MTTRAIRVWYAMTVTFVVVVAFAVSAVVYANTRAERAERRAEQIDRESNRRWCGVVTTLDDAYQQTPPQTPAGKKIAVDIAKLRIEFGC
ncbi:hypothetical protein [Micromonospora tulbaghiae]|uniref:hypothetical protein n=1 Tax=Micromonospora tulbaghiae TaxID=479978 RepID=UPI003414D675